MTTNQNAFEEFYKQWAEQFQKLGQDPQVIKTMSENFLNMQKEFCNLYATKNSTSANDNLYNNLFDTIVKLTNRINELEERIEYLEQYGSTVARSNTK